MPAEGTFRGSARNLPEVCQALADPPSHGRHLVRKTVGKTREGCWQTSGRSPSFRGLPEACLADVRKVPGRRPEGSWQTSGRFLADVRKMPGRPLWKASEKRWEDLGRRLADLWKMANETRAYRGIAGQLPSGLPGRPSHPFPLRFDVVPGCAAGLPGMPSLPGVFRGKGGLPGPGRPPGGSWQTPRKVTFH